MFLNLFSIFLNFQSQEQPRLGNCHTGKSKSRLMEHSKDVGSNFFAKALFHLTLEAQLPFLLNLN